MNEPTYLPKWVKRFEHVLWWVLFVVWMTIITVSMAVLSSRACAQPPVVEQPARRRVEALDVGERAPWAGMLLLESDFVWMRVEIDRGAFVLEQERSMAAERRRIELGLEQVRTAAERRIRELHDGLYRERVQQLTAQLREAQRPSWWTSPILWFVAGVVVTIAAGVAISLL